MSEPERTPTLSRWIFAGSLLAHASAALALHASASEQRTRVQVTQLDVVLASPPPVAPPPAPEEPPELEPEPRQTAQQPVVPPRSKPARKRASTSADRPPDTGSSLPSGPDGDLPPAPAGDGVPGPEPVAAPAPPPPPPPPPPVIEAKEGANYKNNPRPAYPRLALREGWEGKVILRVKVLPDGKVGGAAVQKSAGRESLDEAALAVVKSWTFVPATQGGKPVSGWVSVPFEFKLN